MKMQTSFLGEKGRVAFNISLAVLGVVLLSTRGYAQDVTLANGGSSVSFNLGGAGTGPLGVNNWTVDTAPNISQLDQEWFWYSVNGGTVQSIDQLGAASVSYTNTATSSSLTATYTGAAFGVQITYTLTGDGFGTGGGDLNQSVYVFNTSGVNENVHFYQYANFNLLQNNMNNVYIGGSPGAYSYITQSTSQGGNGIEETINQPYANFAETGAPIGVYNDVTNGVQLNGTYSYGPADAAWALEFSSTVDPLDGNPENAWNVLQDQNMSIQPVPEPATMALIGLGLGACGFARRAWKRNS